MNKYKCFKIIESINYLVSDRFQEKEEKNIMYYNVPKQLDFFQYISNVSTVWINFTIILTVQQIVALDAFCFMHVMWVMYHFIFFFTYSVHNNDKMIYCVHHI